jgi:hypothetical protein
MKKTLLLLALAIALASQVARAADDRRICAAYCGQIAFRNVDRLKRGLAEATADEKKLGVKTDSSSFVREINEQIDEYNRLNDYVN